MLQAEKFLTRRLGRIAELLSGEKAKSDARSGALDITSKIETMTKAELQRECANWRRVWDFIDSETQSFLMRSGEEVYIFKRDGSKFEAKYVRPKLSITAHEFTSFERLHSSLHKRMFLYQFNSTVPITNIVDFKFTESAFDDPRDNEYADKLNAETKEQVDSIGLSDGEK